MGFIIDFFQFIFVGWPSNLGDFMEDGGNVLWLIAAVTLAIWTLCLERLWYYSNELPQEQEKALRVWEERKERSSWNAKQIRHSIVAEMDERLSHRCRLIASLIAVCPLLGLLGTVTGMIEVFHVMAVTGGGDVKLMAGGVSKATIPTMSGMVAAISGIFINTLVSRRLAKKSREFSMKLSTA